MTLKGEETGSINQLQVSVLYKGYGMEKGANHQLKEGRKMHTEKEKTSLSHSWLIPNGSWGGASSFIVTKP